MCVDARQAGRQPAGVVGRDDDYRKGHREGTALPARCLRVEEPYSQPQPRILIVSPVRNEGAHIARVARALAAQSLAPMRWVLIDDCSSDDTYAQLCALRAELPFMTLLRAPAQAQGARDRLACAVEARNFNLALASVKALP